MRPCSNESRFPSFSLSQVLHARHAIACNACQTMATTVESCSSPATPTGSMVRAQGQGTARWPSCCTLSGSYLTRSIECRRHHIFIGSCHVIGFFRGQQSRIRFCKATKEPVFFFSRGQGGLTPAASKSFEHSSRLQKFSRYTFEKGGSYLESRKFRILFRPKEKRKEASLIYASRGRTCGAAISCLSACNKACGPATSSSTNHILKPTMRLDGFSLITLEICKLNVDSSALL